MWRVSFFVLLLLSGCVLGPQREGVVATYDFGLPIAAKNNPARIGVDLLVPPVAAPPWLDTAGILYRLAYASAPRYQAYAESRWVATPAELLTLRLRTRIGAASESGVLTEPTGAWAPYALQVTVEEFTQVFDSPQSSRALVRLRASLIDQEQRRLIAQRAFDVSLEADANAAGAAKALAQAADQALEELLSWLAQALASARRVA
jgi:cholesterol transport system auxiliary component